MDNNIESEKPRILTTATYWESIPESTRTYWRLVASAHKNAVICTSRPSLLRFKGTNVVRRASTGGRWGKSADFKKFDLEKLLAAGYVWRQ